MNAPKLAPASVPLIEKAYVPFRSAFEKPPVTGGGTDGALCIPHAAAKRAATAAKTSASGFTGHLLRTCPLYSQAEAEIRAYCALLRSGCPSVESARKIDSPCRTERSRRPREHYLPRQA